MKAMIQAVQQRASQFDRMILTAIVLVASIFPIELVPGSMPAPKGADGHYSGKQGQIVLVKVPGDEPSGRSPGNVHGAHPVVFSGPAKRRSAGVCRIAGPRHAG